MRRTLKARGQIIRACVALGVVCASACATDPPSTLDAKRTPIPSGQNNGAIEASGTAAIVTGSSAGQGAFVPTAGVGIGAAGRAAAPAGTGAPVQTGGAGTGTTLPPMTTAGMAAAAGSGAPLTPPGDKTCLKPGSGNYTEPGPYPVAMKEIDLGMIASGQHTGKFMIYYPNPLETGCLHPIVAWGNGTGVQGAGVYTFFNSNAASWGMVVAEAEEDNTGSGAFHKAGLDYLLKQNEDSTSMFYHKLSTRAGVSGHSQGGFGANAASGHPNVQASIVVGASMVSTAKVSALVLTGTMDIVMGAEGLVTGAKGPMFVGVWEGGDHFSTETLAGYISGDKGSLQMQRLYAAWFRCFLADDKTACAMFSGGAPGNCGICKDPGWSKLASAQM